MGYANAKRLKTEHSGAKHGKGAFYGRKQEAKAHSNKSRRQTDRDFARGIFEVEVEEEEWDVCYDC